MLVLSRKVGEQLAIGDNIRVVIHRIAGNRVTIGIEAPNDIRIIRGELQVHDAHGQQDSALPPNPYDRNAAGRATLSHPPKPLYKQTETASPPSQRMTKREPRKLRAQNRKLAKQ